MKTLHYVVFIALATLLSGCGLLMESSGPDAENVSSRHQVLRPLQSLEHYRTILIEPFENEIGDYLPYQLTEELDHELRYQLTAADLFEHVLPDSREACHNAVRVQGRVMYYKPDHERSELVARVKILDAVNGKLLGEANVSGLVEGSHSDRETVGGLVSALVNFISKAKFS